MPLVPPRRCQLSQRVGGRRALVPRASTLQCFEAGTWLKTRFSGARDFWGRLLCRRLTGNMSVCEPRMDAGHRGHTPSVAPRIPLKPLSNACNTAVLKAVRTRVPTIAP